MADLSLLLEPASVAIVGASPTSRYGRQVVQNFQSLPFPGQVAAVNPRYADVLGTPCYPGLREVPFVPEAVVLNLAAERVIPALEEAAEVGVKGAVVFAIGFGEIGGDGAKRQERLQAIAREAGMAIVGPNCQGFINFHHPAPLYMGAVQPYEAGSVAFISHSGTVTQAIANNTRGVRFGHIVSCGNEAVIGCEDLLGWYVDDPNTKIVVAFLETIRKPARFFEECERAYEAGKPVVVLKSGRTEAAREAATAHSGALAQPDRLIDELFRRHKVIRVESIEELLETAIALAGPLPRGPGVACTTGSGGLVELLLDAGARAGVTFPPFAPETVARLREILPDFLGTRNPLDVWGTPDLDKNYPEILKIIAEDPHIDAILPAVETNHWPTGSADAAGRWTYVRDDHLRNVRDLRHHTGKTVGLLSCVDGSAPADDVAALAQEGIVLLSGMDEGLRALRRAAEYAKPRPKPVSAKPTKMDLPDSQPFSGQPALDLLRSIGIPVTETALCETPDKAVEAAKRLGLPVVLKLADPDVTHKTERGGVVLGLDSPQAVRAAAERLGQPVLVQKQIAGGIEMILGLQTDPQLGAFVLCGMGGIWAEALDDVAIRPLPLRQGEARDMIDSLRSRKLLDGLRGALPSDLDALAAAIEALACSGLDVKELDVNPLIVLPDGVLAVDALVVP
ncbi:MAG TPA: acetate--CoA ligase family protein [Chloroflexota bacterium]|nr:acetate--CoA ligase family protein [Chloroflexota bacterium]